MVLESNGYGVREVCSFWNREAHFTGGACLPVMVLEEAVMVLDSNGYGVGK
jgi:hypothetical protein